MTRECRPVGIVETVTSIARRFVSRNFIAINEDNLTLHRLLARNRGAPAYGKFGDSGEAATKRGDCDLTIA